MQVFPYTLDIWGTERGMPLLKPGIYWKKKKAMVQLEREHCDGVDRPSRGAAEALPSHPLLFRQGEKSKSQNFYGWKASLEIFQPNPLVMALT